MRKEYLNNKMSAMQAEANRLYSNYGGSYRSVGGSMSEYLAQNPGVSSMEGNGKVRVHPEMQDLVVRITMTDDTQNLFAPLFSANEEFEPAFDGGIDPFNGNVAAVGKGVVIEYVNYTQKEIRNRIIDRPFTINGFRYDFSDQTQIKSDWIRREKIYETISQTPYRPNQRRNLSNNVVTELDDARFFMAIDADATLGVEMKAVPAGGSREVQISFRLGTAFEKTAALRGESVVEKYGHAPAGTDTQVF